MKQGSRILGLGVIAICAMALLAASVALAGGRAHVGKLVRISGPSPFPGGCGLPPYEPGSTLNPKAETSIAVNPRDPRQVLVVWRGGRRDGGGAVDDVLSRSNDGGRTWHRTVPPKTTICSGAKTYDRNSDPSLDWGPYGRAYFTSEPGALNAAGKLYTRQQVQTSADGGRTWSKPSIFPLAVGPQQRRFNDRGSVTADPFRPHRAYEAWRLVFGGGGVEELGDRNTLAFARTKDGGRSWSSGTIWTPQGPSIVVNPTARALPDGALMYTFLNITPSRWSIMAFRSTDGGHSWTGPVTVGEIHPFVPTDPETGAAIGGAWTANSAVAPDGTAYLAWEDVTPGASGSSPEILISRSRDDGRTWTTPRPVAQLSAQAFLPTLAVSPTGTVGVTFYDLRNDRLGDPPLTTDVWFAYSHDRGRSWHQKHLAGPFDLRTAAPKYDGNDYFLGDYVGLAPMGRGFAAALPLAKPYSVYGNSDVFFAPIRFGRRR